MVQPPARRPYLRALATTAWQSWAPELAGGALLVATTGPGLLDTLVHDVRTANTVTVLVALVALVWAMAVALAGARRRARASTASTAARTSVYPDRTRAVHEAAHAVVAHHLGGVVVGVDIAVEPGQGGQTRYRFPPEMGLADQAWVTLVTAMAGMLQDQHSGAGVSASRFDMQHALASTAQLVALGQHPAGYTGPLTTDALLAAAGATAAAAIAAHRGPLEAITEHLTTRGPLDERGLAGLLPARDVTEL